jgi:hypothetical protein
VGGDERRGGSVPSAVLGVDPTIAVTRRNPASGHYREVEDEVKGTTVDLQLNRIFRTFGAGWRGKLDEFDTLKK